MNKQKSILLFVVAVMVTSVVIAGCTSSSNTNVASQTALTTMLAAIHDIDAQAGVLQSWNETWIDANTVKIIEVTGNQSQNVTTTYVNATLKRFDTVSDATQFVRNLTLGWAKVNATAPDDSTYSKATGHKPSTYAQYVKNPAITGSTNQSTSNSFVTQTDNIVLYYDVTSQS